MRFTDSLVILLENKDADSRTEALRMMHVYNGVMPAVFTAAGEAFADWTRTCEVQACDAMSWLAPRASAPLSMSCMRSGSRPAVLGARRFAPGAQRRANTSGSTLRP